MRLGSGQRVAQEERQRTNDSQLGEERLDLKSEVGEDSESRKVLNHIEGRSESGSMETVSSV